MLRYRHMLVLSFLTVLFVYIHTAPVTAARSQLTVATTTTVFADFIQQVGGERVEVLSIVPAGVDPHAFEPTPREARAVATADLLFVNGLGFEAWLAKLLENVGSSDLTVVVMSEGLTPLPGVAFSAHHHDEDGDPHFWLDVTYAMHYVRRIEQALSEHDPEGAEYYRSRTARYVDELEALDAWMLEQLGRIPPERRVLLTYHDAFAYLARRYGLELVGVLVRNPDREPSSRDMANLVREIRRLNVPAIFAEPQINPRLAQTLAAETGITVSVLYSDALTEEVPTYIDMMRLNTLSLVEALK